MSDSQVVYSTSTGQPTQADLDRAERESSMVRIAAALADMRTKGAVTVGAKSCMDEGGKWRRVYPLDATTDLMDLASSLYPPDASTEVWFLDEHFEYMDEVW